MEVITCDDDNSMTSLQSDSTQGQTNPVELICRDLNSDQYHPFDPVEHGLDAKFRLTNFTELRG